MKIRIRLFQRALALALVLAMLSASACSRTETLTEESFVGTWRSSKAASTPLSIYGNGEWEMKSDDGKILHYGVWQIVGGNKIMWSYRDERGRVAHEVNPVLSITPGEFKVQELDNSTTTFTRIG